MSVKLVLRRDATQRLFRLLRIVWVRGTVGDGIGYSAKLTLALTPRLFVWHREHGHLFATFLGIRVHYARSYGGIFA